MFALFAAIVFFIAAIGVKPEAIDLLLLGLALLALHFAFSWAPWSGYIARRQP